MHRLPLYYELANSHGTRDFAGDTDLQATFRNVTLETSEVSTIF